MASVAVREVAEFPASVSAVAKKVRAEAQPAGIEKFVSGLTPVVLTADTWVTDHGFAGGKATPRQSALERGTAGLGCRG